MRTKIDVPLIYNNPENSHSSNLTPSIVNARNVNKKSTSQHEVKQVGGIHAP